MDYDSSNAKTYVGTKTLKAWPMNRLEYNQYRGWILPLDENGEDAGYLVEYEPDGNPNSVRHEGYISWSPAAVFEATYREKPDTLNTWQARVIAERDELAHRHAALAGLLASLETFLGLPRIQRELLTIQYGYMTGYVKVLNERLSADAEAKALTAQELTDPPGGGTPNDDDDYTAQSHDPNV